MIHRILSLENLARKTPSEWDVSNLFMLLSVNVSSVYDLRCSKSNRDDFQLGYYWVVMKVIVVVDFISLLCCLWSSVIYEALPVLCETTITYCKIYKKHLTSKLSLCYERRVNLQHQFSDFASYLQWVFN